MSARSIMPLLAGLLTTALAARALGAGSPESVSRPMTLADARPVLEALGERVPAELRDLADTNGQVRWASWVKRRAKEIGHRIRQGDEDSVVNLMLYGTRFTRAPRATPVAIAGTATETRLGEVMEQRVTDLAAAIESPGRDERLHFVRTVVERHGIGVAADSREATRRYLMALRSRALSANEGHIRRLVDVRVADEQQQRATHATLYRDRGLSTDTSLRVDFAIQQTLTALRDRGEIAPRRVERVGIVGPGLDFVDKAQGYDFFPVQTIQPFALADSLRRLGTADRLSVSALDINPRVIAHVRDIRQRAAHGKPYRVHVLLEQGSGASRLDPGLVEYWRRFGEHVGRGVTREIPGVDSSDVRARVVDIRPGAVLDVREAHLNVVLERLADAGSASLFDLVVATNVLVYYDSFEQALAAANMASMLRDGGLLLTNQPVPLPAVSGLSPVLIMSVAFERAVSATGSHERGDSIFVYRKR